MTTERKERKPQRGKSWVSLNTVMLTNRLCRGKELQITASGTLSEAVEEGAYVLLQVKLGILTLISANASLCEELDKVEKPCPLEKES